MLVDCEIDERSVIGLAIEQRQESGYALGIWSTEAAGPGLLLVNVTPYVGSDVRVRVRPRGLLEGDRGRITAYPVLKRDPRGEQDADRHKDSD